MERRAGRLTQTHVHATLPGTSAGGGPGSESASGAGSASWATNMLWDGLFMDK